MVSLTVILFSKKMLLVRLHIDYIDLLKLKAYKLFEITQISDADLSWLFFGPVDSFMNIIQYYSEVSLLRGTDKSPIGQQPMTQKPHASCRNTHKSPLTLSLTSTGFYVSAAQIF